MSLVLRSLPCVAGSFYDVVCVLSGVCASVFAVRCVLLVACCLLFHVVCDLFIVHVCCFWLFNG